MLQVLVTQLIDHIKHTLPTLKPLMQAKKTANGHIHFKQSDCPITKITPLPSATEGEALMELSFRQTLLLTISHKESATAEEYSSLLMNVLLLDKDALIAAHNKKTVVYQHNDRHCQHIVEHINLIGAEQQRVDAFYQWQLTFALNGLIRFKKQSASDYVIKTLEVTKPLQNV